MSQIILDLSSGNTCKNDKAIVKQMIDAIKARDTGKHEIILKAQLSLPDGINVPLDHDVFDYMYRYGNEQGYKVTSSVADLESLKFLLQYDIPFIKLPNCRELDYLANYIPRGIEIYISYSHENICENQIYNSIKLACVSEYPAKINDYDGDIDIDGTKVSLINRFLMNSGYVEYREKQFAISDHTKGLELYKKYSNKWTYYIGENAFEHNPNLGIWEKHFKLPESTGLDAGEFAITPDELAEVI